MSKRLQSIDFLRGLAIVFVIIHHSPLTHIMNGWTGVDLFFVLSGFLVSGLLFSEYLKRGTIHTKTFLIRRGFKIYPLFWCALLCTVVIDYLLIRYYPEKYSWCSSCYWHELLFVQNYLPNKMAVTWSLAVEEHFYLLLAALVWILYKCRTLGNKKLFVGICIGVFVVCNLLRLWTVMNVDDPDMWRFPTHLRLDSLLFGVLISYFFHFSQGPFLSFVRKRRMLLVLIMIPCLSIIFMPVDGKSIAPEAQFLYSFGFTMLYTGFGILISLLLATDNVEVKMKKWFSAPVVGAISAIGFYSYAIYLFHVHVSNVFMVAIEKKVHLSVAVHMIIQFSMSILVGAVLTKLVETPVLKLRDRIFPKKDQKAI